jgi:hypothetical protein
VFLWACAGAETPAPEAPPTASPRPEQPEAQKPAEAAAEPEPEPETAEAAPEPEPQPAGPSTPPVDLLTSSDTAFMIDYVNSAPKKAAESKCAGDDAKVRADCMKKERDEFFSDVLTFRASESGAVTFTIYQRRGSQLSEIYTVAASLEEKSPKEVLLTVNGKGKGFRPLFANQRSTSVTVPDDYTLLLEDPRFGSLKYTARHGLVEK